MISKEKSFIFVHICKTAGTSVGSALRPYLNFLHQKGVHATAADYVDVLGASFEDYFTFCVVRNPYDWMVSLFEYIRGEPAHFQYDLVSPMSFDEFVDFHNSTNGFKQSDWVYIEGKRNMSFVARFESLAEDFAKITDILDLDASLPHLNSSAQRGAWEVYYTYETRKKMVSYFAEDFANFGYCTDISEKENRTLPELNEMFGLDQLRNLPQRVRGRRLQAA